MSLLWRTRTFYKGVSKKKERDQGKQGEQKAQMHQIVVVAEGSWLDSWPGTMQEEIENQMDTFEVYEMMNGMCEDEGVKELKLIRGEC